MIPTSWVIFALAPFTVVFLMLFWRFRVLDLRFSCGFCVHCRYPRSTRSLCTECGWSLLRQRRAAIRSFVYASVAYMLLVGVMVVAALPHLWKPYATVLCFRQTFSDTLHDDAADYLHRQQQDWRVAPTEVVSRLKLRFASTKPPQFDVSIDLLHRAARRDVGIDSSLADLISSYPWVAKTLCVKFERDDPLPVLASMPAVIRVFMAHPDWVVAYHGVWYICLIRQSPEETANTAHLMLNLLNRPGSRMNGMWSLVQRAVERGDRSVYCQELAVLRTIDPVRYREYFAHLCDPPDPRTGP
ncbi:MAG: hypothetical protein K2W85_11270 [Phycisphaerales bacterium]|nr:hypothetical protein [Phycisphaerales bacterium]